LGAPPRRGNARCSVESRVIAWSARVDSDPAKCLPAKTRRSREAGRFVRRASRLLRVPIDVFDGIVKGIASPARFLTNICMVSSVSAEDVPDEIDEMLLERML